jgi:GNAT superfamily N-acetyltransferase
MADMLVKLYNLPDAHQLLTDLATSRIEIRRALPAEKRQIAEWVRKNFWEPWGSECEAAMENRPVTTFIAVEKNKSEDNTHNPYDQLPEILLGFASYNAVARGMFGPMGVRHDRRGSGIGKALLLACLHSMWSEGYAYAVIGWVGPEQFYEKTVGAVVIQGSEPGPFRGPLSIE